jgi:hypothetical protein
MRAICWPVVAIDVPDCRFCEGLVPNAASDVVFGLCRRLRRGWATGARPLAHKVPVARLGPALALGEAMGSPNSTARPFVALVADNPEMVDELQAYLGRAGVVAHGALGDAEATEVPPSATAVVWFVDDFAVTAVIAAISELRRRRPCLRILLVTSTPTVFAGLFGQAGEALAPVVLSKPVVGRKILDALRLVAVTPPMHTNS